MVVTPTSLTSEMSLSWPPGYTPIHELNKIINSLNILRLSSLVLASLQELNSCNCSQDLYCNKFCTHTDRADSRCDVHFAWHSNIRMTCTNLIYLNLYEMNGWETCSILTPAQRPSRDPFCRYIPADIGARWFRRRSRD